MPQMLAVVQLQKRSNIPQDVVQNTFAFAETDELTPELADDVGQMLLTFYLSTAGDQDNSVAHWLGNSISPSTDAHRIFFYDITGNLDGSPHGGPFHTYEWSSSGISGLALPDQLSVTLSFRGSYGTDVEFGAGNTRPRAQDRGRIYLGPIAGFAAVEESVTKEIFVDETLRTDFCEAAKNLAGDASHTWSVWSRVDSTLKPVIAGWVDNRFDVQRRRAQAATARSTFLVP